MCHYFTVKDKLNSEPFQLNLLTYISCPQLFLQKRKFLGFCQLLNFLFLSLFIFFFDDFMHVYDACWFLSSSHPSHTQQLLFFRNLLPIFMFFDWILLFAEFSQGCLCYHGFRIYLGVNPGGLISGYTQLRITTSLSQNLLIVNRWAENVRTPGDSLHLWLVFYKTCFSHDQCLWLNDCKDWGMSRRLNFTTLLLIFRLLHFFPSWLHQCFFSFT